jgi:hypothetical protein
MLEKRKRKRQRGKEERKLGMLKMFERQSNEPRRRDWWPKSAIRNLQVT